MAERLISYYRKVDGIPSQAFYELESKLYFEKENIKTTEDSKRLEEQTEECIAMAVHEKNRHLGLILRWHQIENSFCGVHTGNAMPNDAALTELEALEAEAGAVDQSDVDIGRYPKHVTLCRLFAYIACGYVTLKKFDKAEEALKKANPVIVARAKLPGELVEPAFRLKWESELLKDDFDGATATCLAFNRLYPESVLADQALMTLGRSLADKGEYKQAVDTYNQVLKLENPISGAEAQYRIGEVLQRQAESAAEDADEHNSKWGIQGMSDATALQNRMGAAIAAYRLTYQRYPESSYAADALGKVVRHYVDTEDFAQAADLLESVFADYPDAPFLDEMLLLWSKVGYRMGDNETSKAKLRQLIFDYPTSSHVNEARKKLAALEGGE